MSKKHIVSWSGGKDSTATIILAHENGIPIDIIVMCLLWFDKKRGIYAERPEHTDWILNYAKPLFESWGYKVKIVSPERDYKYWFYHRLERSKYPERIGKCAGWLLAGMCVMNREKVRTIEKFLKTLDFEYDEYIGIAIDEPDRLQRLNEKPGKISLLEQFGYTEAMATEKCNQYKLYSPIYSFAGRNGCWFCPNQSIEEFAHLKTNHPDLWGELREMSTEPDKISECFSYSKTFDEIEAITDEFIRKQEETSNE